MSNRMKLKWIKNLVGVRPWPADDPFLFVSYHGDWGWAFPNHPHTGFETITIPLPNTVGYVDHSDSLGAHGRFGAGDVQWLTTGNGCSHSEISVHSKDDVGNTAYNPQGNRKSGALFQVWLNLPAKSKKVKAEYKMFWEEAIPTFTLKDSLSGASTFVRVIAGTVGDIKGIDPPINSYATDAKNGVSVIHLYLEEGGTFEFVRSGEQSCSVVYFFGGKKEGLLRVGDDTIKYGEGGSITEGKGSTLSVPIVNEGKGGAEVLILEGKPMREPVIQHGPFVTNTREQLMEVIQRVRTHGSVFNIWPWKVDGPVHVGKDRFSAPEKNVLNVPSGEPHHWPANNDDRID